MDMQITDNKFLTEVIHMDKKIYIFGAHSRAQTLAAYLNYLYSDICIKAYLYDNDEKNPEKIGKIPVIQIDAGVNINTNSSFNLPADYPIYIATRGVYHQQLTEKLKQMGFKTIYPVTQDVDLKLRNQYLEKYYASIGRKFEKLDQLKRLKWEVLYPSAGIYVVKSSFDKPLQDEYSLISDEKEIYAGAVFAEGALPKQVLSDAVGDNISAKNKQFCELTALYWIWKHAEEDIIGLSHYRRHFFLSEDWKERMLDNDVDVILPVPLYVAPSIEENFKKRHDPSDWEFMMQCLKESDFALFQTACDFFRKNLYSPCNMFIMKKEILDELCTWLFPLLFQVAEHGGQKEDKYLNRYPGFISERLISLFFEKNRNKLNIVYADKNFLL